MTRAAGVVSAATLASRVLGLFRDMVIAGFFGAGMGADAFFVAFRIPNFFRRLFAEGSLTASFIPVYAEYLEKKTKSEQETLVDITATFAVAVLFLVTALGVLGARPLVYLLAAGFSQDPEKIDLAVGLTRVCFPYLFFIGLVALCMGVLNAHRRFFAPAFAPVLLNVSMIAAPLALFWFLETPIYAQAIGVLLGGVAQLAFQIPYLREIGITWTPKLDVNHPGVRRILRLMGPAVFGLAITQLTILINTQLASFLPSGTVSYLYFADRLVELPLGGFAVAIGTAALPSLSRLASSGSREQYTESLFYALRLTLFISIPATVALILLREPIMRVLFQRGSFDMEATRHTARALLGYSIGLPFYCLQRVLVPGFYALKDSRTPVKAGAWALLANAATGVTLMWSLEELGLALATAVSAAVNVALLFRWIGPRIAAPPWRELASAGLRSALATAAMGAFLLWTRGAAEWLTPGGTGVKLAILAAACVGGAVVYFVVAALLGSKELKTVRELL
ncbi:MAG: murein biosynthesis integral membrane protein MurJ [Candidatus Methylomirabilis sp.]|nr:murein biosynthesis integral membrane protein MurJ [Deltaproteobacteria bacterium]